MVIVGLPLSVHLLTWHLAPDEVSWCKHLQYGLKLITMQSSGDNFELVWQYCSVDSTACSAARKPGTLQGLEWEFAVINSPQVNAFVVPGGKMVVYTGLMQLLKGPAQESQLAAVIGHEIAHVVARHAVSSQ